MKLIWGDMNFLVRRSLYMARGIDNDDCRAFLTREAIQRHNEEIDLDLVGQERTPCE